MKGANTVGKYKFNIAIVSIQKTSFHMDGSPIVEIAEIIHTNNFHRLNKITLGYEEEPFIYQSPYEYKYFDMETGYRVFVDECNETISLYEQERLDFEKRTIVEMNNK